MSPPTPILVGEALAYVQGLPKGLSSRLVATYELPGCLGKHPAAEIIFSLARYPAGARSRSGTKLSLCLCCHEGKMRSTDNMRIAPSKEPGPHPELVEGLRFSWMIIRPLQSFDKLRMKERG